MALTVTPAIVIPMTFAHRVAAWLGLTRDSLAGPASIEGKLEAARAERVIYTAPTQAARVAAVFTAVGIIATALEQLSIDLERGDTQIDTSRFIAKPDPDLERSDWVHQYAVSLALHGNAYLRTYRDSAGRGLVARVMDPLTVTPFIDRHGRVKYHHNGQDLDSLEVTHSRFLMLPGQLLGLGPIQAAQAELSGHRDVVAASTGWFNDSGVPSGWLGTDQALDAGTAKAVIDGWNSAPAGRTRIATHGLTYHREAISPADAQFLETRRFSKTEILDLFGIPASLALGVDKGDSETYANVEQDWLGFVRFRLMRYVRAMESALTSLIPRGQQARFNLDALLRTDSRTRMEVHKLAIEAGIYGPDYARTVEHLPPTAAPTPTKEVTACPSRPALSPASPPARSTATTPPNSAPPPTPTSSA